MRRITRTAVWAIAALLLARGAAAAVNDLAGTVEDLRVFSQFPADYITDSPETRWLPEEVQSELAKACADRFFSPWTEAVDEALGADWGAANLDGPLWGENLQPLNGKRRAALIADADMGAFPSRQLFAIATANAPQRIYPTHRPLFADPNAAGEGFPFDYLQNTSCYVGTPLKIHHVNRRGDWYLCQTGLEAGWIPAAYTAVVDEAFIKRYRTQSYAAILRDDTALRDAQGRTLAVTHAGAIFPVAEASGRVLTLLIPLRRSDGTGEIGRAIVGADRACVMPLPLTAGNMARQAQEFMGTPYGWGGLFEDRDCSQTLLDLFLPFGLGLPRNSGAQARKSGAFIDLEGMSDEEKLAAIRARGIPFRSLIGMKGHIALFVGLSDKGDPLILHNLWGIRTGSAEEGTQGRAVIGRTVVTTLRPGAERPDVAPEGLLPRVTTLTFLPGFSPAPLENPDAPTPKTPE